MVDYHFWPDNQNRGKPVHPECDGWHVIFLDNYTDSYKEILFWFSERQVWQKNESTYVDPSMIADKWVYGGDISEISEVKYLLAQAYEDGLVDGGSAAKRAVVSHINRKNARWKEALDAIESAICELPNKYELTPED
jgi:hypothetical protein